MGGTTTVYPGIAMQPDDAAMIDRLASVIESWCQLTREGAPFVGNGDTENAAHWALQQEVVDLLGKAQRLMIEEALRHSERITAYHRERVSK